MDRVDESRAAMTGDLHPDRLRRFKIVDDEHGHEHDDDESRCPVCGAEMYAVEVERGAVVCNDCDLRLERHLKAWLEYAAIRDEKPQSKR